MYPTGYPKTFSVASLAAGAQQTLTVESVDHLAPLRVCNALIIKNESGVPCAVYINGDTEKSLVVPAGKVESWDDEFEFSSVVVKNTGASAQNTDGVHVTFARVKPRPTSLQRGA